MTLTVPYTFATAGAGNPPPAPGVATTPTTQIDANFAYVLASQSRTYFDVEALAFAAGVNLRTQSADTLLAALSATITATPAPITVIFSGPNYILNQAWSFAWKTETEILSIGCPTVLQMTDNTPIFQPTLYDAYQNGGRFGDFKFQWANDQVCAVGTTPPNYFPTGDVHSMGIAWYNATSNQDGIAWIQYGALTNVNGFRCISPEWSQYIAATGLPVWGCVAQQIKQYLPVQGAAWVMGANSAAGAPSQQLIALYDQATAPVEPSIFGTYCASVKIGVAEFNGLTNGATRIAFTSSPGVVIDCLRFEHCDLTAPNQFWVLHNAPDAGTMTIRSVEVRSASITGISGADDDHFAYIFNAFAGADIEIQDFFITQTLTTGGSYPSGLRYAWPHIDPGAMLPQGRVRFTGKITIQELDDGATHLARDGAAISFALPNEETFTLAAGDGVFDGSTYHAMKSGDGYTGVPAPYRLWLTGAYFEISGQPTVPGWITIVASKNGTPIAFYGVKYGTGGDLINTTTTTYTALGKVDNAFSDDYTEYWYEVGDVIGVSYLASFGMLPANLSARAILRWAQR